MYAEKSVGVRSPRPTGVRKFCCTKTMPVGADAHIGPMALAAIQPAGTAHSVITMTALPSEAVARSGHSPNVLRV